MKKLYKRITAIAIIASIIGSFYLGGWWMLWGIYCVTSIGWVTLVHYATNKLERLQKDAAINSKEVFFDGLTLRRHDAYVDFVGGGYAYIHAAIINGELIYNIFVGSKFFELSHSAQLFIVFHELGHLEVGSSESHYERLKKAFYGRISEVEHLADLKALTNVGREATIAGLKEIKKSTLDPFVKREMGIRIKAITRMTT